MTDTKNHMLAAALEWAARGWPVFPCSTATKQPLVKGERDGHGKPIPSTGGVNRATTDPVVINGWWTQWPDAMIGAAMGRNACFALDFDPRHDTETGEVFTLEQMKAETEAQIGVPLPETATVITPSGGVHLYYMQPDDDGPEIRNRGNLPRHVDVRGAGGYVIVPPSRRMDGREYRWHKQIAFAEAPPELIAVLRERRKRAAESDIPSIDAIDPQGRDGLTPDPSGLRRLASFDEPRRRAIERYVETVLSAECKRTATAPPGKRNVQLNESALKLGHLVGAGVLGEGAVRAALEGAATSSGLTAADGIASVRATIDSGLRAGVAEPQDISRIGLRARSRASDPGPPREGADARGSRTARTGGAGEGRGGAGGFAGGPDGAGGGGGDHSGGGGDGGEREGGDDGPDDTGDDDPTERLAREPQNDIGNARRLIGHFGRDMLVVREIGPHVWTGTHWDPEGGEDAFARFAQLTAERVADEAVYIQPSKVDKALIADAERLSTRLYADLDDSEKEQFKAGMEAKARLSKRRGDRLKFGNSCGNANRLTAMVRTAAPHITVSPDAMDADPMVMNVRNGTLRLVKERVRERDLECPDEHSERWIESDRWRVVFDPEHRRDDRISKVMPVEYDPEAKAPRWTEFCNRFQPKAPVRDFLKRFHGYALTGMTGEQVFLFNYGLGANGKSTFMEAIARLQGDYARMLPVEALTGDMQRRGDQATPEFARLPGARLVRCAEMPRGQAFRESTLKMLTGGEAMLVRNLHQGFFEMRPCFKAIGSGNDRPPIGGVDEGIWRRMKLVPWDVQIPADERRPMEKVLGEFMAEGPGILNWLLEGLIDYLEIGLAPPSEIDAATGDYRDDMDPVGEFTRACVQDAPDAEVTARDLFKAYADWCQVNSVKPFSEKGFANIMVQKGFKRQLGRIRKYIGVRLAPDLPRPSKGQHDFDEDDYGVR